MLGKNSISIGFVCANRKICKANQKFHRTLDSLLGNVETNIRVGDLKWPDEFYIISPNEMIKPIIIGTPLAIKLQRKDILGHKYNAFQKNRMLF